MNDEIYDPPKSDINIKGDPSLLTKAWNGEIELWKAFWLVHIVGFILSLVFGMLSQMMALSLVEARLPHFVTLISFAIIFPLTLVSLWRSSPNPKVSIKGALAKLWVCLAVVYYFSLFFRVLSGPQ